MLKLITSRRSKKRLVVEVFIVLTIISSISLFTYLRFAYGATRTWDGGGTEVTCPGNANGWSCAQNWSSDTVPTSADIAAFDNTSDKDATVDASFTGTVDGVDINTGYDGTITQARSFVVEGADFNQAAGTWDTDGFALTINTDGDFIFSNGIHDASGSTVTVERSFTYSGGTLTATGTTFVFDDNDFLDSTTLTCTGVLPGTVDVVKNVTSSGSSPTFTLSSGCTINIGTFDTDGSIVNNGTINGTNITTDISYTQGDSGVLNLSGVLLFDSTHFLDQSTVTCNGSVDSIIDINKDDVSSGSGVSFTISSNCEITLDTDVYAEGTFTNNGTVNATNIRADGYFNQNGTLNMTGTLTFGGASLFSGIDLNCGSSKILSTGIVDVVLNKTDNAADLVLTSDCMISGDFTRTNGVVNNTASPYTLTIQGDLSISTSDTFGGANLTVEFGGSNNQTVTLNAGSISSPVEVDKTTGTVTQLTALTLPSLTITDGEYLNSTFSLSASGTVTVNDTFTQGTGNVTVGTLTVGASGNYSNPSTGNLIVGAGGVSNSGNITLGTFAACPTTDGRAITSSSPGNQRSWTGTGVSNIYDTLVTDQGGSATVNAFSSTSVSGNGTNWVFYPDECELPINPRVQGGARLRGGTQLH